MILKAAFVETVLAAQRILTLIEEEGPQTLDELYGAFKDYESRTVLLAVDRLKREGEISVEHCTDGAYRIVPRMPSQRQNNRSR